MPRLNPWAKKYYYNSPRFFGRNEFVSLLIAITMGLQHAMAMVGGESNLKAAVIQVVCSHEPCTCLLRKRLRPCRCARHPAQQME